MNVVDNSSQIFQKDFVLFLERVVLKIQIQVLKEIAKENFKSTKELMRKMIDLWKTIMCKQSKIFRLTFQNCFFFAKCS